MSRGNSRRRQQAMNQWRRGRVWRLADVFGVPVYLGDDAWYIPPDPRVEREEYVRQVTARVTLEPGETVMQAEVGRIDGVRIIGADFASEPTAAGT